MMNIDILHTNPERASLEYRKHEQVVSLSLSNRLHVSVHNATDEEIAVAFDSNLVDRLRVIVNRDNNRRPFISFDVDLPGVRVDYFWVFNIDDEEYPDHATEMLMHFQSMLVLNGVDDPGLNNLERMAGVDDE